MRKGKIYCPVNGRDCPYYKDVECGIENPYEECDDFYAIWGVIMLVNQIIRVMMNSRS